MAIITDGLNNIKLPTATWQAPSLTSAATTLPVSYPEYIYTPATKQDFRIYIERIAALASAYDKRPATQPGSTAAGEWNGVCYGQPQDLRPILYPD